MSLEFRRVDAAPRAGVVHRIAQVEHLMEHHILERQPGGARIVEDPADHDHVVRRIEVPETRPRTHMTPSQSRPRHHSAEVFLVQILEDFLEIMNLALRAEMNFAASCLTHYTDPPPHVPAI